MGRIIARALIEVELSGNQYTLLVHTNENEGGLKLQDTQKDLTLLNAFNAVRDKFATLGASPNSHRRIVITDEIETL